MERKKMAKLPKRLRKPKSPWRRIELYVTENKKCPSCSGMILEQIPIEKEVARHSYAHGGKIQVRKLTTTYYCSHCDISYGFQHGMIQLIGKCVNDGIDPIVENKRIENIKAFIHNRWGLERLVKRRSDRNARQKTVHI
jgi:hypothetical protein